jgi:hypothetical protein
MNDLKDPIDTLKQKVELLIAAHTELANRLQVLEAENIALKKEVNDKDLLIKENGENNKIHNLAQQISSETSPEQNEGLKLIITDLVKEIDKCITLLGKNV